MSEKSASPDKHCYCCTRSEDCDSGHKSCYLSRPRVRIRTRKPPYTTSPLQLYSSSSHEVQRCSISFPTKQLPAFVSANGASNAEATSEPARRPLRPSMRLYTPSPHHCARPVVGATWSVYPTHHQFTDSRSIFCDLIPNHSTLY